MIEAYGNDTVEWVNKTAKIELALNTQGGKSIILIPTTNQAALKEQKQSKKSTQKQQVKETFDGTEVENIGDAI